MCSATSQTSVMTPAKLPVTNMTVIVASEAAVYDPMSRRQQDVTIGFLLQRRHLTLARSQCCPLTPVSGHPGGFLSLKK